MESVYQYPVCGLGFLHNRVKYRVQMYKFTPDEFDHERANHQGVIQGCEGNELDAKRIGNLGEIAFEWFCRQYVPSEFWSWNNAEAIRRCDPESFASNDFEVFGYDIDVKTSRDVSAFLPENLLDIDDEDDIIVMVWHRDDEDSMILLGWAFVDTLKSKVNTEQQYDGDVSKLDHLSVRPMNELVDLGPNAMNLNQLPDNPFEPGDRVVKGNNDVGVVVEVVPPDKDVSVYGTEVNGEVVNVTFPSKLDSGPGDWRELHPALLASYCHDQGIKYYSYNAEKLSFADPGYVPGDLVVKDSHDDPDPAMVVEVDDGQVKIVYEGQVEDDVGDLESVSLSVVKGLCETSGVSTYSYDEDAVSFISRNYSS